MKKQNILKYFFIFIVAILISQVGGWTSVSASPLADENFDSYSTGSILGQGGWTNFYTSTNEVVSSSHSLSGFNSLTGSSSAQSGFSGKAFISPTTEDTTMEFDLYFNSSGVMTTDWTAMQVGFADSNTFSTAFSGFSIGMKGDIVAFTKQGSVLTAGCSGSANSYVSGSYSLPLNTWNHFKVEFKTESNGSVTLNYYINSDSWTRNCTTFSSGKETLAKTQTALVAGSFYNQYASNKIFVDNMIAYSSSYPYVVDPTITVSSPLDSSTNNYVLNNFSGSYINGTGYDTVLIQYQPVTGDFPISLLPCAVVTSDSGSYSCNASLNDNTDYTYSVLLWDSTQDFPSGTFDMMLGTPYTFSTGSTYYNPSTETHFISTYPADLYTQTGSLTSGSASITGLSDTSSMYTNQVIHGEGIEEGSVISSIDSSTSITISQNAHLTIDTPIQFVSTVPQSVTLSTHLYMNSADWKEGAYLDISVTNDQVAQVGGSALGAWNSAFGGAGDNGANTIQIPITASDLDKDLYLTYPITFSTTGNANITYRIITPSTLSSLPILGSFFNGHMIASFTTDFTISAQTVFDKLFKKAVSGNAVPLVAGIVSGGIVTSLPSCEIATFSMSKCLTSLFLPTGDQLGQVWTTLHDKVLTVFPLGYVTRLLSILNSHSAVMPPALSYKFGTSSPSALKTLTDNDPIVINPLSATNLAFINSVKSDQVVQKTIWDIFDPFFQLLVNLALLFAVFTELLKIDFSSSSRGSRINNPSKPPVDYEKMSDKEFMKRVTVANTEKEYRTYKQF